MSNFHVVAELVFAPYHRYLSHLDTQQGPAGLKVSLLHGLRGLQSLGQVPA